MRNDRTITIYFKSGREITVSYNDEKSSNHNGVWKLVDIENNYTHRINSNEVEFSSLKGVWHADQ